MGRNYREEGRLDFEDQVLVALVLGPHAQVRHEAREAQRPPWCVHVCKRESESEGERESVCERGSEREKVCGRERVCVRPLSTTASAGGKRHVGGAFTSATWLRVEG